MTVRVLSPVIEEITEAALWLDDQSAGLGEQFRRLVDAKLSEIACHPYQFPKSEFARVDIDLRFAIVDRFK